MLVLSDVMADLSVLLDTIGFGLIVPVLPRLLVELTGQSVSHAALDGAQPGPRFRVR